MARQREGKTALEQTPGVTREGGNGRDDNGDDEREEEEDDEDVSKSKILALQAKHKATELHR